MVMKIMIEEPPKADRGHGTQKTEGCGQRLFREHPLQPLCACDEREFQEARPLPKVTQLIEPALWEGTTFPPIIKDYPGGLRGASYLHRVHTSAHSEFKVKSSEP